MDPEKMNLTEEDIKNRYISPAVFETVEKETGTSAEESKDLDSKERDCKHWWQKIFR